MNLTNYKKAKIFIRLIKILLLILISLYLFIKLSLYINNQIETTMQIIKRAIINITPYRASKSFELMIDLKVTDIESLVKKGDMTNAFVLISNLYYEIFRYSNEISNEIYNYQKINRNVKHYYELLFGYFSISVPYLQYTMKLFFLSVLTVYLVWIPLFYLKIIICCLMTILIFHSIFSTSSNDTSISKANSNDDESSV